MNLIEKSLEETTSRWHKDYVDLYSRVFLFLVKIGLAHNKICLPTEVANDTVWYIPAKGDFENAGNIRVFDCELGVVKVNNEWYWTIWFD